MLFQGLSEPSEASYCVCLVGSMFCQLGNSAFTISTIPHFQSSVLSTSKSLRRKPQSK